MAIRLNSEKRINNDLFKLKIGTTNKINPQIIYIEGKTFISPEEKKTNYSEELSTMRSTLVNSLSRSLTKTQLFVPNKYIIDFQVAKTGINPSKRSFLGFQLMLKQKFAPFKKVSDVKDEYEPLLNNIISTLVDKIQDLHFNIYKSKK